MQARQGGLMTCIGDGGLILPGDYICSREENKGGNGIFLYHKNEIRSSLFGCLIEERKEQVSETVTKCRYGVVPEQGKVPSRMYVLNVGDTVYGKITKTSYNFAVVDIVCVGDLELLNPVKGIIRREDIQEEEIDKVVVPDTFRSLDFVRAVVVSQGDSKYYFLSTAKSHLGVVLTRERNAFT
jgi:exosome complex RNA-binding protein Csl4